MTVINLDKERNLKYGFKSLKALEKYFKKSLKKVMEEADTLDGFQTILFHGLKHEDENLTVSILGDLLEDFVDEYGLQELYRIFGEAMVKANQGKAAMPSNG